MAARRERITDFARDGRLRHPVARFLAAEISSRESAVRRPRDGHGAFTLEKRREVLDEAELLDAGRHEAGFLAELGEHAHADRAVHRGLHVRIEELAAFDTETLLEHEHRVWRFAEERRALGAFLLQVVGEERADLIELLPGLRRC